MEEYKMSFFKAPIWNKSPLRVVSLFWVWLTVTMKWMQLFVDPDRDVSLSSKTERLRSLVGDDAQRQFKGKNFDYITPAGTFVYCDDKSLVEPSNMLCIDLDHLDDDSEAMKWKVSPEEMKQLLLKDLYWGEKVLLMFTSPRGHGLKVFVEIALDKCDYATWFNAIRNYLMQTYGLGEKQVDPSVANVSRACFLSYDPDAYLRTDQYEFFI
ncbi:MAG: hypothetical protein K6G32_02335 [Prevotella sp.]|nr:hypothetical protein [Prevotella sp.]